MLIQKVKTMAAQISVKYPFIGVQVVRGRDWIWRNQDGGSGCIGVIKAKSGDKWVEVLWESPQGMKNCEYRIGHDDYYDLYFVNAKDALLQEAMERFPSGCSYKTSDGEIHENVKYDKETPYYHCEGKIALAQGEGLVYDDGEWAQIISPNSKTITQKSNQNGSTKAIILQTTDFKISRATSIRGVGLKGPTNKILIGGRHRYN